MAATLTPAPDDIVVTGFARTPFGRFGGALRDLPLPQLGAAAVRAAIERSGIDSDVVDELVMGVNFPGSDRSVARQVQLHADIPSDRVSYTVDRACCSSLAAVSLAARGVRLGDTTLAVAGGVDNLSLVPYFVHAARWGQRIGHVTLEDQLVISCPHTNVPRAVQAGEEAVSLGIGREEQDRWAVLSQQRFDAARKAGLIAPEIVAVDESLPQGGRAHLTEDECPRPDASIEKLAKLRTVYGSPTVTPGNAPNMSTGASAVTLTRWATAEALGLAPVARLRAFTAVSGEPQKIASIPAAAATTALARAGLELDDIDAFEVNEAFAAVPLVTTHVLGGGDPGVAESLRKRTNLHGGAIAIGHPTGATAARMIMTMVGVLGATGGTRGLVTICGGIGEAHAVVVEVLS